MEVAQNYKIELQRPQVLYILGGPGSGKGTQCERLVRDYKFEHISVGDVMRAEIKSGSREGEHIKSLVEKGSIVPTEFTVGLLLKAIKSKKAQRFLIDGFPRGLEQALYLEKHFREIDYIINFDVPEDILIDRLTKRAATSGRADDNPETIKNRIMVFNQSTAPVLDAYQRTGRVATVSGLGDIGDIYQRVRQAVVPNLIFFYGAPCVGKSQVAKNLCAQTGYRYLSLQELYTANNCSTDVLKINKLMRFLGESADRNYVIDSFLDNKAQAVVFFEHFGKPRYLVYFQSSKDEIESNIRKNSKTDALKKSRLQELQSFLKNRDELLAFFAQFSFFHNVPATQSIENMVQELVNLIRPKVMVALTYNNIELAEVYIQKLQKELGYIQLAMDEICEQEVQRGTSLGNQIGAFTQSGQTVPAQMQVELLRKILYYNPNNTKFLLTGFPERNHEFEIFEESLFKIDGLINFMKPDQQNQYSAKENPILHFQSINRCLTVDNEDVEIFKNFITRRTKFGIVFGPSCGGKSTLSRYIGQKYGYQVVEWEPTIIQLKEKLGQPGEPLEDVPLPKLVDYYKRLFDTVLKEKYLFDGFPPGCDSKAQIELFLSIGQPTWVMGINILKDALWKRFKLKNEMDANQELTPEDDDKMGQLIQSSDQSLQLMNEYVLGQSDCKFYQIDGNNNLDFTQRAIDYICQKRVFLARNLLQEYTPQQATNLKLVFLNIAAQRNMTFIDVEALLQEQSKINSVVSEYQMRWTQTEINHPSNYSPDLVVKLITQHISSLQIESRDLLLWGYPSADHLLQKNTQETFFPRVQDEIIYIEKLIGPIRIAYIVTDKILSSSIEDPQWELKKPEEKVVQKADGDEGLYYNDLLASDEKQEQAPEDGDENKPKFNIYEYNWTKSDAHPKNIAQIYSQMKNPLKENIEVSEFNLKNIYDHFGGCYEKIQEDLNANFFIQIQIQNQQV